MSHRSRQTVVFSLALLTGVSSTSTCYYNTGDIDDDGHPCNPDAVANGGHSACCHANDVCWSDGSCSTYGGNIPYTMSCTDSTWGNSACPTIQCEGQEATDAETWMAICYAHNGTSCCLRGSPTCCTDSSSIFFDYSPGRPLAILDSDGSPVASTSSSATTVTATPLASNGLTKGSKSGSNAGEIGLGVALGVVIVIAAIAITALSMKARSERATRKRTEAALAAARGFQQSYGLKGDLSSLPPWVPPPVELPSRQF
ncbi:hypothetical protein VMCG_04744 [Cytospora schulzeri]|uniref:Mid2 domain-containing protein n=1 Tax=Cytospora schulzeri TaxID=448051 RepID=A0A423WN65_9PEZI|nr:hypothetical protein VMCG_04744 [Valsa malicola]